MANTKPKSMDESTLNAIVAAEERQALGYVGKLSEQRRKALYYYHAEPVEELAPPEVEGRSAVVSSDVADTIEWILPSLLRIFTSGDQVVRCDPRHWQDEAAAKQATDLLNYVFNVQNDGFMILHDKFKDALLQKRGIVKVWWDNKVEETREDYANLSDIELSMLSQDESVEVIEHTQNPDGSHDVACKRSKDASQVRVEVVPPEEFLISRRAKKISDAPFVAHRVRRTLSDLRAMGYDENKIANLGSDERSGEFSAERLQRLEYADEWPMEQHESLDPSQRDIWITEAYMQVDYDGDGIAEWRKIVRAGNVILDNEECDGPPFASVTPIKMPHEFFGLSIADITFDIQRIKTAVMRQLLDSMYLQNNQRYYVDMTKHVNLDDLLTNRPGGIVRGKGPDGVQPLGSEPINNLAIETISYLDSVKENRTGVTKYNQGLDANTLNKTATGINSIMNASQQRIELIARIFAEGVRDMFGLILKLLSKYQQKAMTVRLEGQFVDIDPREWKNQFDLTISVGIGTGNKQEMLGQLMQMLQVQEQVGQSPWGQMLLQPSNVYNVLLKLEQATGIKGLDAFTDPKGQQPPQPGQHPDPRMMQVQSDQQVKMQDIQAKYTSAERVAMIQANADIEIARINAAAKIGLAQEEQIANTILQSHQMAQDDVQHQRQVGAQMMQAAAQHQQQGDQNNVQNALQAQSQAHDQMMAQQQAQMQQQAQQGDMNGTGAGSTEGNPGA